MKHYDIITIGNATRDIFLQDAQYPVLADVPHKGESAFVLPIGGKIDVPTLVFATGGGASNAAATFANFRFHVAFCGTTGKDRRGGFVINDMRERGIDTSLVYRDPHTPTAYSVILTAPQRGRTVLTHRCDGTRSKRHFAPLARHTADWYYITSLGGNLALLRWILALAAKNKTTVFCNPGVSELRQRGAFLRIAKNISLLLLNREEANLLAHTHNRTHEAVVRLLARVYAGVLIVTDGRHGAIVHADGLLYSCTTHVLQHVVEWTGAGDAFGSGFLTGLLRSKGSVTDALQYATANAESVLMEIGAKNGLLSNAPKHRIQVKREVISHISAKGGGRS